MSDQLSNDELVSLSPLLGSLARLVARGLPIAENRLHLLLSGVELHDSPTALRELKRWLTLLEGLRDEPDEAMRHIVEEALMVRSLPEATVLLAINTVLTSTAAAGVPTPPALAVQPPGDAALTVQPERLEWSLLGGNAAVGELEVRGGPGQVQVDSDQIQVIPAVFGPDISRLQVTVHPLREGILWSSIRLHGPQGSIDIPVIAQWTLPVEPPPLVPLFDYTAPPLPVNPSPQAPITPAPARSNAGPANSGYSSRAGGQPVIPPIPSPSQPTSRVTSCPQCKQIVVSGNNHCPFCGAWIQGAASAVSVPQSTQSVPTRPPTQRICPQCRALTSGEKSHCDHCHAWIGRS